MDDQAIIQHVSRMLQQEFGDELLGVLATGSRVRGEGDANSDIDVVVVIDQARRQRRNILVEGVEVEMFLNPPGRMKSYMDEDVADGSGLMQHMLMTGHLVHDPHSVLAPLQERARSEWAAGPRPMEPQDIWQLRYRIADALRDISDVVHQPGMQAICLIGEVVPKLLETHYRLSGRWRVKNKRLLKDLAGWDEKACDLVDLIMEGPLPSRLEALRMLAEHVLAPVGGAMPLVWDSGWQELSPTTLQ